MKLVLVVEDDEDDLTLMKMACQRTGIPHSFQSVTDGDAAVKYLSGTGQYSNRVQFPLPDLIFLDVRMPKRSGHEVLEWIRSQPQFKHLPVVMITHSQQAQDMDRAYKLGVTSYLRKVASQAEFGQAVRVILKYWLELNLIPGEIPEQSNSRTRT
jgi:CheY-like chemotaxis protein